MDIRISDTGIRSGEFITASPSGKQNKGTVMQIRGNYPPDKNRIGKLDPITIRDTFNTIPFFSNMPTEERLEWLVTNGTDETNIYLEDTNIWVRFVKIGAKNFFHQSLGEDVVNRLLQGNPDDEEGYWLIKDVYNMFPRKPGSRAKKTTLIFRPSNWSLMIPKRVVNEYNGVYINLNTNQIFNGEVKMGKIYLFNLNNNTNNNTNNNNKIAIVLTQIRKTPLTDTTLLNIAGKYGNIDEINVIRKIIDWFPPSLHKSLIQKLIRTRCNGVEYGGKVYNSGDTLMASLINLILNPGVFVPNIRRFVTGLEAVTKRLAVSIQEDSYTERNDLIMGLYAAAMLAQDDRNWLPTDEMIDSWFKLAIEAQQDPRLYLYNNNNINETNETNEINNLTISYLLLREIRSFQSDINMVKSIAENKGKSRSVNANISISRTMPLIHCLDHHSLTEIAHYVPYDPNMTYGNLFKNIWKHVVGVNPRYHSGQDRDENKKNTNKINTIDENDEFVKNIRIAQRNVWISKMYTPQLRPTIPNKQTNFSYRLDPSWLAGLIGPIEIKLGGSNTKSSNLTAIVVLRVDNIYDMVAVKRPQRDTKANPELTEIEQSIAIAQAKIILGRGYKLSNVPPTLSLLNGSYVTLRDEQYIITLSNGQHYYWDTIINLQYTLPIHESIEPTTLNALLYTGDGIDKNSNNIIKHIKTTYNTLALRRLSTYLVGYKSSIELEKISRDGTGTYYQVVPEDTAVNEILCYLCVKYPAALMKTKTGFRVKNGPLLWAIRDNLISNTNQENKNKNRGWNPVTPEKRKRWEHQIESVEQMVKRNKVGKKGHLIWIKVGLGKTMIAIDYLDYLIQYNKMPKYCVYSLPASAINNIQKELNLRGVPNKLLDARQTSKPTDKTIEPYMVCIIKHDHMRLNGMDEKLKEVAREMVFIIDEFHKTLSKTIRTSLALELARLSYDFVGMSGTIIKDNNHDELIQWLEQVVEFEVNEKNYWVAIGALISRKVNTKVVVDREVLELPIPNENKEQYYSLVPEKLGGTARQIDFTGAINLCYDIVTQEMVNTIMGYINLDEGVFVVAKDIKHQETLRSILINKGINPDSIHLFNKDNQITLTPEYNGPVKVVITTKRHSEGYTLTKFRVMITSVYFSNQATREQLEGRINRIGQTSPSVKIIIYHTGILSYIHEKYEKARTLSEALKGFANEIGLDSVII